MNRIHTFKRSAALLLSAAVVFSCVPMLGLSARAEGESDLTSLEAERARLEVEAQAQQQVIDELNESSALIYERKVALDKQTTLLQEEITNIEEQIAIYEPLLADAETALKEAEAAEEAHMALLRRHMRAMEERTETSFLEFLFQATSLTDLLGRIYDIRDIMEYDRTVEKEYMAAKEEAEACQQKYLDMQDTQISLRHELTLRQEQLDTQLNAACQLLADLDENSEDAQENLDAIAAAQAATESSIVALLATYSSSGSGSGYSSYTGTGSLTWPVPSSSTITSDYGERESPTEGASTNHGGVDIGASEGSSIVAAGGGTVILAEYYGGYGNCVMIDHGNGVVTVYAHMSEINVSAGETVSAGENIGAVGSTGIATGPHCHYEVRVNGEQVDPTTY